MQILTKGIGSPIRVGIGAVRDKPNHLLVLVDNVIHIVTEQNENLWQKKE